MTRQGDSGCDREPNLLAVEGLCAGYGRVDVVHSVDLGIPEKGLIALIGPNGAGKTTLLHATIGIIRARSGSVWLRGEKVGRTSPQWAARNRIAFVTEGNRTFGTMTVEENIHVGARAVGLRIPDHRFKAIYDLFPVLGRRRRQHAGTLSGGEKKMLGIARGLAIDPRLLILDEPSAGLAPAVIQQIGGALTDLNSSHLTMLVVEQSLELPDQLGAMTYLMQRGQIVWRGLAGQLALVSEVASAVVGGDMVHEHHL